MTGEGPIENTECSRIYSLESVIKRFYCTKKVHPLIFVVHRTDRFKLVHKYSKKEKQKKKERKRERGIIMHKTSLLCTYDNQCQMQR